MSFLTNQSATRPQARMNLSPISHPLFLTLLLVMLFSISSWASSWSQADKAFAKGDFAKALELYYKARTSYPDDRRLNYDIGTSLYKLQRFEEAKTELMQAVYSSDTNIASHAAYNLANVHYRLGQKSEKPADKVSAWREAIALLKKAIDLNPHYENAKRNAEFIQRKLKEELDKQKQEQKQDPKNQKQDQKPLSEAAKQALARAMQLCSQGRFTDAKTVLDQIIQADETASQLNSNLQRIQDIIDISAGREPSKPMDASNSTQDLEVI